MNCRALRESDIPILKAIYDRSELAYEFPDLHGPLMEQVLVLVNEKDQPVMAGAVERIVQSYLWVDESLHPAAQLRGIRQLHEAMAPILRQKGYTDVSCFVPPKLEKSFGRRLMRTFGWTKTWPSFVRSF